MDTFGLSNLRQLAAAKQGPCVSLFLPTHVTGPDAEQDAIRLKNLLDAAEEQLVQQGVRAPTARDLLADSRELPRQTRFWDYRSRGLALFLSPEGSWTYRVPVVLPELVVVGERFHLKELLPLLTAGDRFLILVLSQNQVRLLEASRYHVEQVDVPEMPGPIDEALDLQSDSVLQSHVGASSGRGRPSQIFHGQGAAREDHKDELVQYFHLVCDALGPQLREEQAPLLLAGVDYLLPIFRGVCRYPHLEGAELAGNWEHLSEREIHQKAWPLMEPRFLAGPEKAAAKYRRLAGTGLTAAGIGEVVSAAAEGRIESLLLTAGSHVWGVRDAEGRVAEVHAEQQSGDEDLLDVAAEAALLAGGAVYAVAGEIAPEPAAAAVLRY